MNEEQQVKYLKLVNRAAKEILKPFFSKQEINDIKDMILS